MSGVNSKNLQKLTGRIETLKKDLARAGFIQNGDSPICSKLLSKISNKFASFEITNGAGSKIQVKEKKNLKSNGITRKLNGNKKVRKLKF
jgi:hypothetical protein